MSRVKMGAKYPRFSPIKEEPANALPIYATGGVVIGELIFANVTVNLATAELHSDDALNIKVSEFASASIAMNTDGIEDEVASALFGAEVKEQMVVYNVGDVAPNGGLAYYSMMKDKLGKVYFKGYFFPKVQAAMGNDNVATKSGSISFQTANTTFTVMKCENGDWMQTEIHPNEAAAKAWVDKMVAPPDAQAAVSL